MSEPVLACQGLSKIYRQGDSEVPVLLGVDLEVLAGERVSIVGVAFVLALVATIYPSWRASRVNPAEALRYE